MRGRRTRWLAAASSGAIVFLVYLFTLPPSLTWAHFGADGGDLVTAVVRGGIPHPPGFPTYLLLGELFVRLPWGDPAWRLNLMSALLAAGASALTAVAVCNLRPAGCRALRATVGNCSSITSHGRSWRESILSLSKGDVGSSLGLQPALCAGLALGLAPLLWSQALIVEVYAAAAFFGALVAWLALRGGPAWALGLAWGLGVGAHPTLLLLAPLVGWGAWAGAGRGAPRLAQTGLVALLSWGLLYGGVLLARGGVRSPWGDVTTPGGWFALVSGRLYHGYLFALPPGVWPRRVLAWVGLLARQFTPLGALLAGWGWWRLVRARPAFARASGLAFGAVSVYALGYNTADSMVYLVPALPLAALWLGAGLARATGWLRGRLTWGSWLLLLLPLAQALLFWGQMDVSGDRAALDWAQRVLDEAPAGSILVTAEDAHTFTLWYARDVLDRRPDVVVLDRDLWAQPVYRSMVMEMLGLGDAGVALAPEDVARRAGRPLVVVDGEPDS